MTSWRWINRRGRIDDPGLPLRTTLMKTSKSVISRLPHWRRSENLKNGEFCCWQRLRRHSMVNWGWQNGDKVLVKRASGCGDLIPFCWQDTAAYLWGDQVMQDEGANLDSDYKLFFEAGRAGNAGCCWQTNVTNRDDAGGGIRRHCAVIMPVRSV